MKKITTLSALILLAGSAFALSSIGTTEPENQPQAPGTSLIPANAKFTTTFTVEFDSIRHWVGSGSNQAALLVQFNDGEIDEIYVWGYKWEDGESPSGEDMFRAIALECTDLTLFTQYTGWMGNTVCGIGYSKNNSVLNLITYNFAGASADGSVSFEYYNPNTSMGQTKAPGDETPAICAAAIAAAETTHIIEHPLNAEDYGYAAYDYDWWQTEGDLVDQRWQAGWYKGYWSYWVGTAVSTTLSYSGLGMTSRKLTNGDVDAWFYQHLTGDGYSGASSPTGSLNYIHFGDPNLGAEQCVVDHAQSEVDGIYDLQGVCRGKSLDGLLPGIYLIHSNGNTIKIKK